MTPKELLDRVDDKACLDFLAAMARHKSYSQTPGERVLAEFMAGQMRALGLEAELTPVEGERVNAVGRLRGAGGGSSLLFNGHIDTNPVSEGWTVDPWGGKVDDRFIYGIGVSNMKAGDAAYFCAVRTLVQAGVKLKGDVTLTYVVGELQGGVGTLALLRQGLRADYFVNSEPTDLAALTMHAAAFTFLIELVGNTRHMSKREEAVDAIAAACDLIPRLDAMVFSGAPTPEHAGINPCMWAWCMARWGGSCTNGGRRRWRISCASRARGAMRRGRPRPARWPTCGRSSMRGRRASRGCARR